MTVPVRHKTVLGTVGVVWLARQPGQELSRLKLGRIRDALSSEGPFEGVGGPHPGAPQPEADVRVDKGDEVVLAQIGGNGNVSAILLTKSSCLIKGQLSRKMFVTFPCLKEQDPAIRTWS